MAPPIARAWRTDAAIAAGFLGVGQLGLHVDDGGGFHGTAPAAVTAVLVAAIDVPLLWRRRYPIAVLVAVALAIVVPRAFASVTLPLWGGLGALVFALYTASRWAPKPWDALALVAPAVGLAALSLEIPGMVNWAEYSFSVPVLLLGWLTGQGVRRWHELSRRLRQHLDDVAETEQARAAAAVSDERARIARELHDVVAHAVSVMVVQAGSARLGMAEDPEGSAAALRNIEETGRQALVEMRHMLGLLRAADAVPSLAPQPTLRALPALVEAARSAGQDVDLQVDGAAVPLPPGLDLSAYRIVQEALTNAVRHAGPVPVAVRVRYGREDLTLDITNGASADPPKRPGRGTGHGLIGMRERTELFGGSLSAGRTADGGFAVRAVLPLPEPPPHGAVPAPADRFGTVVA